MALLPTYPRLNLKTKRIGIEAEDWFWVASGMMPGLLLQSVILFVAIPLCIYVWAAKVKSRKPRGWIGSKFEFFLSQRIFIGELEENENINV